MPRNRSFFQIIPGRRNRNIESPSRKFIIDGDICPYATASRLAVGLPLPQITCLMLL